MKKIDTLQVTDPSTLQPFTARSLKFLQDATSDDVAAIIKSIVTSNLGSYSLTIPYVISGCVVSDSNKDVTAGELFYGGKYYETTALNGTTNVAQFVLTLSQDATADPVKFSDSSTKNVHNIYKYVPTDTATAGDFDATDLVSLYGSTTILTSTSAQTTIDVNITSAGPFAYGTDSYAYSWYINKGICFLNFKAIFTVTDGAVVDKINIPLPTGVTKATTLTEAQAFRGTAFYSAPTSVTAYMMMQVKSNDTGSEGQRVTLVRTDDTPDISMTTSSVFTISGSIQFPIA